MGARMSGPVARLGVVAVALLAAGCGPQRAPPLRPGTWISTEQLGQHWAAGTVELDAVEHHFYLLEATKTAHVAESFVTVIPPNPSQTPADSRAALQALRDLFGDPGRGADRGLEYVEEVGHGSGPTPQPGEAATRSLTGEYLAHVGWAERRLAQGLPPAFVTRNTLLPVTLQEAELYLGPDRAAISYQVTPTRSVAFVVVAGGSRLIDLGPSEAIAAAANDLRARVIRRDDGWRAASQRLCELVVEPVASDVHGAEQLVVSGDGPLHGVPWSAVCEPGAGFRAVQSLVELPSLTLLRYVNSASLSQTTPQIASFGNPSYPIAIPSLPHAELEAMVVAAMIDGSRAWLGGAATEAAFRDAITDHAVVHLATHALALSGVEGVPPAVFLAADSAHDGLLTTAEIAELDLREVELAVVSACQSGVTTDSSAIDSLSAAFIVAGARTTVTSLWSVDDAATARLMTEFYARLWSEGPAAAMRHAQEVVAAQPGWEHPYFWASFQVSGGS